MISGEHPLISCVTAHSNSQGYKLRYRRCSLVPRPDLLARGPGNEAIGVVPGLPFFAKALVMRG